MHVIERALYIFQSLFFVLLWGTASWMSTTKALSRNGSELNFTSTDHTRPFSLWLLTYYSLSVNILKLSLHLSINSFALFEVSVEIVCARRRDHRNRISEFLMENIYKKKIFVAFYTSWLRSNTFNMSSSSSRWAKVDMDEVSAITLLVLPLILPSAIDSSKCHINSFILSLRGCKGPCKYYLTL